jgi:hypothetical protein
MARLGRGAYIEGLYDCIMGEFNRRRLDPKRLKATLETEKPEEESVSTEDTEDFETIAFFDVPGLVSVYQQALEQEGIKTFVPNDYAPYDGQFYRQINLTGKGIMLQVHEKDVKKAIELLSEDPACQKYIVYPDED